MADWLQGKKTIGVFWIVLVLAGLCGCQRPVFRQTRYIMGTFVEVRSFDRRAADIVFNEFKRLDAIFNTFDPGSELSRLNQNQTAVVSQDLYAILKDAGHYYRLTDGVFDVTVGPVSLVWKKGIARQSLPDPGVIHRATEVVGFDNVYFDDRKMEVRLLLAGMRLDLGGIAKGFALKQAVAKLKEADIHSALINAGGNVYCLGKRNGAAWRVGVQDPFREGRIADELALINEAAATAGNYQQYFEIAGKCYSHIIDPRTGYPADAGVAAATVVSADPVFADVLSTACVILGVEGSAALLKASPGVRGILILEDRTLVRIH